MWARSKTGLQSAFNPYKLSRGLVQNRANSFCFCGDICFTVSFAGEGVTKHCPYMMTHLNVWMFLYNIKLSCAFATATAQTWHTSTELSPLELCSWRCLTLLMWLFVGPHSNVSQPLFDTLHLSSIAFLGIQVKKQYGRRRLDTVVADFRDILLVKKTLICFNWS